MLKSYALMALIATTGAWSCHAAFVSFESESGGLGSDFTNGSSGAMQFISVSPDRINTGNPGSANRVATYAVTFPTNGTYHQYGRLRVGPDTANAASVFYRLIKWRGGPIGDLKSGFAGDEAVE